MYCMILLTSLDLHSHCHWLARPQLQTGYHKQGNTGQHLSTGGWKTLQTTVCRILPTLVLLEAESEH